MAAPALQPPTSYDDRTRLERKRLRPADVVTRSAVTQLLRRQTRQNELEDTAAVVRRVYADCPATTAYIARAATSPATTTSVGWAAELVGQATAAEFLAGPPGESAFSQLAARAMSITLPPGTGSIKIPTRQSPQSLVGSWLGEGAAKPVTTAALVTATLTPSKVAAITQFSEELAEHSVPAIETVVRWVLEHDLTAIVDSSLVDSVAASAIRPAGLFAGVTPITASALTPTSEAMFKDLAALAGAVTSGYPGAKPIFIAHAVQAGRMAALGYQVIETNYMPANSVGAADATSVAMLTGSVSFAASRDATLHEESTTPLPLGSGEQGSGVLAVPMRSLFQSDCVAIRSTLRLSWLRLRTGCTAIVTGATW